MSNWNLTTEDIVYGKLAGIPLFLLKRKYEKHEVSSFLPGRMRYVFRFENNYGASIIEHNFDDGAKIDDRFELAVLKYNPVDNTCIVDGTTKFGNDVIYGNQYTMELLLWQISGF